MGQRTDLEGKSAIVTGAGSGIGAAISRALVSAGTHVVLADLDLEGATAVAVSCTGPGTARAVQLDVVDAAAVSRVVDDVVRQRGTLDLIFNNAGIAVGGETEDLSLSDWDRIIDVNLRGVVHGVAAAYPVMVRQRSGHIVNTASLAGLVPAGLLTSYSMTKHAVVGLSLSLRAEAASKGVRVLAVCPAAVETPLLDTPGVGAFDGRRYVTRDQGVKQALAADVLATEVLEAVQRNRALLVTPRSGRVGWRVARLSPAVAQFFVRRVVAAQRKGQRS